MIRDVVLDPDRIAQHEQAAHEKRNWIRLTAQCNNRCTFCLDSDAHNGTNVSAMAVKAQIIDGRKRGATRLILSGGEPTIHPSYVEFIALGHRLGYRRIQTVTNGRMFSYPDFLARCLDAGLDEITFSIHGPNARIHDALVGVKGAFDEEVRGLQAALADGRPIVNVDIVINRANVKHLTEMLDRFIALGVREFDLLQVIPFGRAFHEGLSTLFYDLEEAQPYLQAAFAYARRPDLHVWLNRFPPQYMEGYESLIQDPYKLNDEVRGRREEFDLLTAHGTPLSCKAPERCTKCYLERLCGTLDQTLDRVAARSFTVYRMRPGDPPPPHPIETAWLQAPTVAEAAALAATLPCQRLILECDDYAGLGLLTSGSEPRAAGSGLDSPRLEGKEIVRAWAATPRAIDQLAAAPGRFAIAVALDRDTAAHLVAHPPAELERLVLALPNRELVTDERARAADLGALFRDLAALPGAAACATENIPACLSGRPPQPRPEVLDARSLGAGGRVDVGGYAGSFIRDRYYTKSRRCRDCVHDATCEGVHINFVRAHGYAPLQPVTPAREAVG
jgi:MoaA/NifB/PqqE/SkfB family radical SAM enzyme